MTNEPVESPHEPPTRRPEQPRVSRLGLVLFFAYVALYASFMGLVLASPETLSWRPVAGVNLAILSGLGLILAAIVLSVVFMLAGTTEDNHAA